MLHSVGGKALQVQFSAQANSARRKNFKASLAWTVVIILGFVHTADCSLCAPGRHISFNRALYFLLGFLVGLNFWIGNG